MPAQPQPAAASPVNAFRLGNVPNFVDIVDIYNESSSDISDSDDDDDTQQLIPIPLVARDANRPPSEDSNLSNDESSEEVDPVIIDPFVLADIPTQWMSDEFQEMVNNNDMDEEEVPDLGELMEAD